MRGGVWVRASSNNKKSNVLADSKSSSSRKNSNRSSKESNLMDTAAGFFKSLTGDKKSEKEQQRSVTPPPPPSNNHDDDSPPDTPISRFRREPTINPRQSDDNNNNDYSDQQTNNADPLHLLMMRSFGSVDEQDLEPDHVDEARQAISSIGAQSRLSDERIHQILLAAMHYQTDQSHTLPSRPRGLSVEIEESPAADGGDYFFSDDDVRRFHPMSSVTQSSSFDDLDQVSTTSSAGADSSVVSEVVEEWHEATGRILESVSSAGTAATSTSIAHNQPQPLLVPRQNMDALIEPISPGNSPIGSPITTPKALARGVFRAPEEKKETEDLHDRSRVNDILTAAKARTSPPPSNVALVKSTSMTESDVGSLDGLPPQLQTNWREAREKVLEQLDGVPPTTPNLVIPNSPTLTSIPSPMHGNYVVITEERQEKSTSIFDTLGFNYCFWGPTGSQDDDDERQKPQKISWKEEAEDTLALLGCAPLIHQEDPPPAVPNSLVRVTDEPPLPSFAETIREKDIDYRLPSWVQGLRLPADPAPYDGSYGLGKSRTVIVHEICRGNWTWCTAWSPKGDRLAMATQNHHLAVVETLSSAVWRVRHDRRLVGPAKNHTTHSVRCIAWGKRFIATGGTGDAVSIISSIEPYPVLHLVKSTGFVGSLSWKPDSDILAIGSRLRKLMIVKVESTEGGKSADAEVLYSLNYKNWVNKVAFSPGGTCLAVGVATGEFFVYNFLEKPDGSVELNEINVFKLDDSVLDATWSADGHWLYAGGEDFHVTIIDTRYWQVVHRINRERWVQCIAASNGGTHVAVGGVNSEVSLLDVENGWDSVMGIDAKGLVPLSAQWHPKDQAIALTGQSDSVIVVETTNARHVRGHHLRSVSSILAIEFSPDGRLVLVGNEGGVVTLFSLSKSSFEIVYEMAVTFNDRLSICWSPNGIYAVVGSKDALLVLGRRPKGGNFPEYRGPSIVGSGGYSIQKIIRSVGATNSVSIDFSSRFIAVGGERTMIFDSIADFRPILEWSTGLTIAVQWSPDRRFLATLGGKNTLTIFDTADSRTSNWHAIFSLKCDFPGCALSWSPQNVGGLQYLAYGGKTNHIYIMEIRTAEHTWETVLRIPREEHVHDLDWSSSGLLAAGSSNGTVAIIDLGYLHCGIPVHEKDYTWQRQALTCFTEIRRNRGTNVFKAVRWIPSAPGSDSLLAVGGSDGEVEIMDLTERKNCRGFSRKKKRHEF